MNLGIGDTPVARRSSAPGWRDPRLWIGLAIVAASVVAGALVLGTSDDTVPVWAAARPLSAGHLLDGHDLVVRRIRFDDPSSAARYVGAGERPPSGLTLGRDVGAGELLPRAAVGPAPARDLRQVPVSLATDQVPESVGVGDEVDVYLRPASRAGCGEPEVCDGRPVVAGVTVVDAPAVSDAFSADGSRMLVLAMTGAEAQRFFHLLSSTDSPALTVVGRG